MTSLFFYIGGNIFRSFLTVIFLYFYFCKKKKKDCDACRFFYVTKRTLINISVCMALGERLGLVHKLRL